MRAVIATVVALVGGGLVGCGPTCQSTCQTLYSEGSCDIRRPSKDPEDLISECESYCELALEEPGEVGDYDPYERRGSSTSITLENDKQAAIWMDCVASQSCERLQDGYCAPIW